MKIQKVTIYLLKFKIKLLRIRMVYHGQSKGLTHPDTIKHSQNLDVQLNRYHRIQSL
ncbi:aspartyl-phosphate phosphatase Spo0E family protein [Aquibacillus saliphilus]|uniref:aspartyl-phosphate phosphatase Spo0E family protein n=1 Tax=Aquibacillus saliphilus TaxID=1909422 RepID=UPI001CF0673D|nr:aspartyl-phosphate phosphatase Spo0E family protein [Aquibacillus saliphilus]